MENQNQTQKPEQQTINVQVPTVANIASKRSLIPVLFSIVIVFFFFNFFTISCGEQKVGSVSGIDLVTGTELKKHDMFSGKETKGEEIPSSVWAIIAFSAAIVGLGVFLIKEKREAIIGTGAGAIGFGSLIILQFVAKNAVDQNGEGALHVDFEFAYWGAVIAMGIAGFISYLRMQKTHNFVVSVAQPPPPVTPNTENITQPIVSVNPIQQTNNFDIGEWFNKNKKLVVGFVGLAIILFGVYYIFLKHDPATDGKNIAISFCNCNKDNTNNQIKIYEDFISNYDNYIKNGRVSAISLLESKLKPVNEEYQACQEENQLKYSQLKEKYVTEKEKLEKFDFAYNAQQGLCQNEGQTRLNELFVQVQGLINKPLSLIEINDLQKSSLEKVSDLFSALKWNINTGKEYTLFTHGTNENYHLGYNFNYGDGYDLYDIIYTMTRWSNVNGEQVQLLQKTGHSNVLIYYTEANQFDKLESEVKNNYKLFATKSENDGDKESFYRNGNSEIQFEKNIWISTNGISETRNIAYAIIVLDISDINKIKSELCTSCKGHGYIYKMDENYNQVEETCSPCNGSGKATRN